MRGARCEVGSIDRVWVSKWATRVRRRDGVTTKPQETLKLVGRSNRGFSGLVGAGPRRNNLARRPNQSTPGHRLRQMILSTVYKYCVLCIQCVYVTNEDVLGRIDSRFTKRLTWSRGDGGNVDSLGARKRVLGENERHRTLDTGTGG